MENRQNNGSGFNFSIFWHNFLRVLSRLFWIPLLFGALTAGYRYYTITRSYTPIYESLAVFRVSATRAGSIDISSYGFYMDSNAASKIAATYPYVMSSDQGKSLLKEKFGVSSLPATVSCRAEATMLIFSSRGSTPERSFEGLRMAVEVFPEASVSILDNFTLEVFDEAVYPTAPINSLNYLMPTIQWGLLGLAAGLAVISLLALLRKTVHNSEDLRELLNVPCLGLLPQVSFKARTKANRAVLLTNPKLDESYVEAVRAVRFQLRKELENQRARVIMVTSTIPGEGKSTLSANLALARRKAHH